MSNTGQAVLTVVGTVVGTYFGYPQLGFALGSLAGQALFPTKLPTVVGPRLADFGQTQSSVGAPIPQGWGTCPATGNIIAKSDVREVIESDELGGKGGPTQTVETPTYFQDFAIGFNDGEIAGVRRIWSNGKLIYDRQPKLPTESDSAFTERMAANDLLDENMVVYFGTEDQLPDPTLEAFYGVGQISAFRGLAYLVMINWKNKPEDGMKMPLTWRLEFFTSATVSTEEGTEYSNEVLYPWLQGFPVNPRNLHEFVAIADGLADTPSYGVVPDIATALAIYDGVRGRAMSIYQGCAATEALIGGLNVRLLDSMGGSRATISDRLTVWLHYNSYESTIAPYDQAIAQYPGFSYCEHLVAAGGAEAGETTLTTDGYTLLGLFTDTGNNIFLALPPTALDKPDGWDNFNAECELAHLGFTWANSIGVAVQVTRVPRKPDNPCAPLDSGEPIVRLPGTTNFAIVDGKLTRCGDWELVNGSWHVMRNFQAVVPVLYPRNPVLPVGHVNDTRAFWENAYREQVALSLMPLGLVYGVHYPQPQSFAYQRTSQFDTYETHPVSVAEPIRDMCLQEGYAEADFNVSDLEDTYIIGFVRTGPMAARGAIEALRPIAMFDIVEDEAVLTFLRRGKGIKGTIDDSDLGAFYSAESSDKPVSKIITRKMMDYDIPRQVRLHYLSYDRDYDTGQSDSPVRTDTDSVQTMDFDTTCVLTDDIAAQIAQRIWADFWASRWSHTIYLDASAHQYKATDCLAVPVDGQYQRMRVGSVTDKLPSVRQFELVRDDAASFISYALASEKPPQLTDVLSVNGPCEAVLLDLPLLRDEDNDSGFYAVARPLISDSTFKGAVLLRSVDGGNYQRVAQFQSAGIVGTIVVPVNNVDPAVIDHGSSLVLTLPAGVLTSRTLVEVLAGANAAAIGADGRWEVIQWLNAEQLGTTTWELTGLLRGRRGTEHNVSTSVAGDQFVVLAQAVRVGLDIALVGKTMLYKCVATDTTLESANEVSFAGQGVALKPFSPVHIEGDRDPETGIWLVDWLRRGRIGQTLQSGTDIALSEEVEDYEAEITTEEGVPVRVLSVSAEEISYGYNEQVVDFGATPDTLYLNIYPMSTKVGRGYPGTTFLHAKQPYVGLPGDASFVPQSGDGDPVPAIFADGKFILCKRGTKGAVPVIGFYSWTGAGTAALFGTNYYDTAGIERGGIPGMYSGQIRGGWPYTAVNTSAGTFLIYWSYQAFGPPSAKVPAGRHLYYTTASGGAIQRVPTASTIIQEKIIALHQDGSTFYALVEGSPSKVYTSSNGVTWALAGTLSGDVTSFTYGDTARIFKFNGVTYLLDVFGLLKNPANNLLSWTRVDIGFNDHSTYDSYHIVDLAVNTNCFIILAEVTYSSDHGKRNRIIAKPAGSPDEFVISREVLQASDTPPALLFDLEWRRAVPFGGGFAVYGCNPFSGVSPYVLTSPDGVSPWTMTAVDLGDAFNNSNIINVVSNATHDRIVASDSNGGIVDGSPTLRFSTSTNAYTFTAISF
jgi:hypothetical protein